MSVLELKARIHQQVDLLTDSQDIEDLYANIIFFFQSREISFDSNSPQFLQTLNRSLQQNHEQGIDSKQLRNKVKEWLSK